MADVVIKTIRRRHTRGAPNKVKNASSRREQIKRYYERTYRQRKIRRLIKHNSWQEAWDWAVARNCTYLVPAEKK